MRCALGAFLFCTGCASFAASSSTPTNDAGADGPDTGAAPADAAPVVDAGPTIDAAKDGAPSTCAGAEACERVVFVTSVEFYPDDLASLAGADKRCNDAAEAATSARVMGRKFQAWLSDGTSDAATRLTHGTKAYVRPDSMIVAADWTAFASATHAVVMNIDERDNVHTMINQTWTGTNPNGTATADNCNGWATRSDAYEGTRGQADQANANWSNQGSGGCGANHRIYCVEK